MRKTVTIFFLIILFALSQAPPSAAQGRSANSSAAPNVSSEKGLRGKRLILKDGSVQIVREYQVIGDRVRYYSMERSDWEEIPASLVDWEATRKAASQLDERAKRAIALAHRVDLEKHPGSLDVDGGLATLGLPPGVLLPPGDGMYAFNGRSVVALKEDLAKSKLDKGKYIVKLISPLPVVGNWYTISLKGKRAKTRIAYSEPIFFFRTNSGIPPRIQLIHANVKGSSREIGHLSENMGQKKTYANEIPVHLQPVDSDTYRLMATQDLPPGEYVLAQMIPNQSIDLYVWDFGIDPPEKTPSKK